MNYLLYYLNPLPYFISCPIYKIFVNFMKKQELIYVFVVGWQIVCQSELVAHPMLRANLLDRFGILSVV